MREIHIKYLPPELCRAFNNYATEHGYNPMQLLAYIIDAGIRADIASTLKNLFKNGSIDDAIDLSFCTSKPIKSGDINSFLKGR